MNLPKLLEIAYRLPDGTLFNFPRNKKSSSFRVNKALIVQMLTKLQPRVKLFDAVVGYFLSRIQTDDDIQVLNNY
jgi:hypothetical protein